MLDRLNLAKFEQVFESLDQKVRRLFLVSFLRATISATNVNISDKGNVDSNFAWIKQNGRMGDEIHLSTSEVYRITRQLGTGTGKMDLNRERVSNVLSNLEDIGVAHRNVKHIKNILDKADSGKNRFAKAPHIQ